MPRVFRLVIAVALASVFGCHRGSVSTSPVPAGGVLNRLTAAEQEQGWRLLFDGNSTAGWRAYRADSMPSGWQVVDGALTRVGPAGDIITREQFATIERTLDSKVADGRHNGTYHRGSEDDNAPYCSGPERQVRDDARH